MTCSKDLSMKLKLLQILLVSAAFGWAISIYGVFCSWDSALVQLKGLGADAIPDDPMLDYWLRMAAGAFTGIGVFCMVLAINPKKYSAVIPFAGLFLIIEGIILLVHGIRLGLEPIPFYFDVTFCLATGTGIWLLRHEAAALKQGKQGDTAGDREACL